MTWRPGSQPPTNNKTKIDRQFTGAETPPTPQKPKVNVHKGSSGGGKDQRGQGGAGCGALQQLWVYFPKTYTEKQIIHLSSSRQILPIGLFPEKKEVGVARGELRLGTNTVPAFGTAGVVMVTLGTKVLSLASVFSQAVLVDVVTHEALLSHLS